MNAIEALTLLGEGKKIQRLCGLCNPGSLADNWTEFFLSRAHSSVICLHCQFRLAPEKPLRLWVNLHTHWGRDCAYPNERFALQASDRDGYKRTATMIELTPEVEAALKEKGLL